MRGLLLGLASVGALLALAGFGRALHPAADTLALGRPAFALLALTGAALARARILRLGYAAIGLAALATVLPPLLPQPAGGDIRIYSKNLWSGNPDPADIVADIEAADVDAVFLQEVAYRNQVALDLLSPRFPHVKLCVTPGRSGVAILSRLPFDGAPRCSDQPALAAAPVRVDGRRLWLVSAHIAWLWPHRSTGAEAAAGELLGALDAPAVIAGDFNAFPWTGRVRRVAAISDTRLAGPIRPSFVIRRVPLPIDLAFAPGGGSLERRPRLGSDHFGIVADLALDR